MESHPKTKVVIGSWQTANSDSFVNAAGSSNLGRTEQPLLCPCTRRKAEQ